MGNTLSENESSEKEYANAILAMAEKVSDSESNDFDNQEFTDESIIENSKKTDSKIPHMRGLTEYDLHNLDYLEEDPKLKKNDETLEKLEKEIKSLSTNSPTSKDD